MMIKPAPHELSRADFIAAFGGIYEHSPWVAGTLFDMGVDRLDADPAVLAKRMADIVDAAAMTNRWNCYARIPNSLANWPSPDH